MTEGRNLKICVLSSPPLNSFWFFFFMCYSKESDWASWTARNQNGWTQNQKKKKKIWHAQWYKWHLVPPQPFPLSASKYMFSETVIGLMLDVEQTLCPHHEVKLTFMKLKSQVGFLCWYGFMRHRCSALHISCALKAPHPPQPPAQEEWNAWKHYCAWTIWPTVNGWVKVPFEMHDITLKKKPNTQENLAHVLLEEPS